MPITKKKIFNIIKIILLLYAIIGIALFYLQENFLFHPKKLAATYVFNFKDSFTEIKIPFTDTDTISVVKFFPKSNLNKGVVIFYHGNKDNIEHYATGAKPFTNAGYQVWMEDYPGYGKSTGTITEIKLYQQALQIKKMADASFGADNIILYGKSLGTGLASYVASNSKAKMLILETPYYSIPSLAKKIAPIYPTQLMLKYNLPTYSFLENVSYPIIIFHGTDDYVIPYSNAIKLKAVIKNSDLFVTIPAGTHHNINTMPRYTAVIDSILQ